MLEKNVLDKKNNPQVNAQYFNFLQKQGSKVVLKLCSMDPIDYQGKDPASTNTWKNHDSWMDDNHKI